MTLPCLLAVLLSAVPALAQTRAAPRVASPAVIAVPLQAGAAPAPSLSLAPTPMLAPSLSSPLPLAAAPAPLTVAAAAVPAKVAALSAGISKAVASLAEAPSSGAAALTAGRDIEAMLAGAALSAPSASDEAVSPAELAYAAGASASLAARADDLAASKGLKASRMSGADFLGLLEEARVSAPAAPTTAAASAAREIEAAVMRVARALIPADEPLAGSVRRALAVWQVFDQELELAAAKGSLAAIAADARLFASQVEASVEPARTPAPAPALAPSTPHGVHPEDPADHAAIAVPGSIFGWKPIEASPDHGLPPLDALIRRALADKKGAYAKGFELPGAVGREDAGVYLYGERHTDGGLIAANMKRLVEDARAGRPMIVLVEGYTGWSLRGWPAVTYLADRGLDAAALADKEIAIGMVEVRGWDTARNYDASKHPLLQHHMDALALNHLAHGELRGWRYYRELARAALAAWRSYREMWRAAIVARNGDLDGAVAQAAADAGATGATVHVIAGTDHLVQSPRLAGWPLIGRPTMRRSLRDALGGRPYWASQPPNTQD